MTHNIATIIESMKVPENWGYLTLSLIISGLYYSVVLNIKDIEEYALQKAYDYCPELKNLIQKMKEPKDRHVTFSYGKNNQTLDDNLNKFKKIFITRIIWGESGIRFDVILEDDDKKIFDNKADPHITVRYTESPANVGVDEYDRINSIELDSIEVIGLMTKSIP